MVCTLYLTSACELCDEALEYLLDSGLLHGHLLETIDIASDESLFETFGPRIPVVQIGDFESEWPFDESKLRRALQSK